jgi:hypothetical protein
MSRPPAQVAIVLAGMLMLGGCPGKDTGGGTTGVSKPSTSVSGLYQVSSMDALTDQLATRSASRLGQADNFQIIVTQAAYPVGTLMRQGTTIPIDYSSCLPASAPPLFKTPSLFPGYLLTSETAAGFGLDDALLNGIAEAGAKIARGKSVRLDFADSGISTLSDSDVDRLVANPGCAALLRDKVWLVRGYIFGKRTFQIERTRENSGNLKVTRVANFDVKVADGNSALSISDAEPVGFLQIISAIAPPVIGGGSAPVPTQPTRPAPSAYPGPISTAKLTVQAPSAPQRKGRVYVQRDRADTSGNDAKLVTALRDAGLAVVPQVEAIDSDKMPAAPQVRYFNDGDAALAEMAAAALRAFAPGARTVRISLPSPSGQLEVWLARAAASGKPVLTRRSLDAAVATKVLKAAK